MKKSIFTLACLGLALSGCAGQVAKDLTTTELKKPVRLPYNFYLDRFVDTRAQSYEPKLMDVLSKREEHPFKENVFVESLVKQINGKQLYDYEDAHLRIELKDYAAFKEGLNYTLSFYVDVTAFNDNGRVLGTGVYSCLVDRNEALALVDKVSGLFKHDQDNEVEEYKVKEVWRELYTECANDIAYQFNHKVKEWEKGRRS